MAKQNPHNSYAHALSIRSYNHKTNKVSYSDPTTPGVFYWEPLDQWLDKVQEIFIARIK